MSARKRLVVVEPHGFCSGVARAVQTAEALLARFPGETVYGLNEIVHNQQVVARLTGLGMRESSGEHCCGRDTSASNTPAETAEAGAWQTSWNSHVFSTELPLLFDKYMADDSGCLLDVFSQGVTCSASNWESYGSGDGFDFQELEKNCPAFAAEYAAVMLRVSGGSVGHYGPLRTRAAEVRPECDELFQQVQAIIAQTPSVCGLL